MNRWLLILLIVGTAIAAFLFGGPVAAASLLGVSDKVKQLASAIAFAEGYWDLEGNILAGNVPARSHNPGDLGPGDAPGYPAAFTDGSNVVAFPDDSTGWEYLYTKCQKILNGTSAVNAGKGLSATFADVAQKYAGDWQNWVDNVTSYLGTTPTTTVGDWLKS